MDIIEFSDEQNAIRLEQEKIRLEITQLLKRYKDLDKIHGYTEYRELHNGLLDIPFGKFAEKLMQKLHLPYNPKLISATTQLGPVDIEHLTSEKYKSILHTYENTVEFNLGYNITLKAYIKSDRLTDQLSEIKEYKPVLLKNPEEIKINKTNITLNT
ncbi:MAG: hypothetical protein K2K31_00700, partial [Clostridia bacterium]|nr:hypothetical protein [Clostridia bacterium]